MTTFVDTSALYAILDEDDANHPRAAGWFAGPGSDPSESLVAHSYIVVETAAIVHRRLGARAIRVLFGHLVPALDIQYVNEGLHRTAAAAYLAALRRGTSFVDCVSFELMRSKPIDRAFTFDSDFSEEGFEIRP